MAQPTRIWFMRHGEVEAPWVGTFLGTKDVGLSPLGHHQAEAIRAYLEPAHLDAVVASPRKRSLDTAAPLAKALQQKLVVRKGLAEMDFGAWEGMHWPDIQAKDPQHAAKWEQDPADVPCPQGESCNAFASRVHAQLEDILREFEGRTIAVFSHAGTNRSLLAHLLGRSYLESMAFAQDYGCVNAGSWGKEGYGQVALVNFVPGPRAKVQGD